VTDILATVNRFRLLKNPHHFQDWTCLRLQMETRKEEHTVVRPLQGACLCHYSERWTVSQILIVAAVSR